MNTAIANVPYRDLISKSTICLTSTLPVNDYITTAYIQSIVFSSALFYILPLPSTISHVRVYDNSLTLFWRIFLFSIDWKQIMYCKLALVRTWQNILVCICHMWGLIPLIILWKRLSAKWSFLQKFSISLNSRYCLKDNKVWFSKFVSTKFKCSYLSFIREIW